MKKQEDKVVGILLAPEKTYVREREVLFEQNDFDEIGRLLECDSVEHVTVDIDGYFFDAWINGNGIFECSDYILIEDNQPLPGRVLLTVADKDGNTISLSEIQKKVIKQSNTFLARKREE